MRWKIYISTIITAFLFTGMSCQTTSTINSWNDSALAFNKFNKILVFFPIKDSLYRNAIEREFVDAIVKQENPAVKSINLISPNTRIIKKDFSNFMLEKGFDGLLQIKYQGTIVKKISRMGEVYFKTYHNLSKPFRKRGYYEMHKTVMFEYRLFTGDTLKSIWRANTKTLDPDDEVDLAKSIVPIVIKDLQDKKLLKSKK